MLPTQLITLISGFTATSLNLFLLPITFLKSSDKIGRYKYFLMAYTTNAALLSFSQLTALPAWYIPNNGYMFISTVQLLPRWFQQSQIMLFVVSYILNAMILMLSFIYRLKVIENANQSFMSKRNLLVTVLGSSLFAIGMISIVQNIMPSEKIDSLFHDEVYNATGVRLADAGYIGGEITIDGHINFGMALCLGMYVLFIDSAVIVILFCWFKIGKKLSELRDLGNSYYKFQYRLFTTLPIIFNIIPAAMIFVLSLAKVSIGNTALLFGTIVTIAQIVDPLCTLFLVQDYKDFLLCRKVERTSRVSEECVKRGRRGRICGTANFVPSGNHFTGQTAPTSMFEDAM